MTANSSNHTSGAHALAMAPWQGLLVALLAACGTYIAAEVILPVFDLPEHLRELSGNTSGELLQEFREATNAVQAKNASLVLVLFGASVSFALAGAELWLRRPGVWAILGALLAVVVAAVIALGSGAAASALMGYLDMEESRLGKAMLVQGAALGLTGLGIGVGVGVSTLHFRRLISCVCGCLVAGLLAALIYPLVVGLLFPRVNTEFIVPDSGIGRMLWMGISAGLIGAVVCGLGKEKKRSNHKVVASEDEV